MANLPSDGLLRGVGQEAVQVFIPFAKDGSLLRGHWLGLTCLLSSCRMPDVLPAH